MNRNEMNHRTRGLLPLSATLLTAATLLLTGCKEQGGSGNGATQAPPKPGAPSAEAAPDGATGAAEAPAAALAAASGEQPSVEKVWKGDEETRRRFEEAQAKAREASTGGDPAAAKAQQKGAGAAPARTLPALGAGAPEPKSNPAKPAAGAAGLTAGAAKTADSPVAVGDGTNTRTVTVGEVNEAARAAKERMVEANRAGTDPTAGTATSDGPLPEGVFVTCDPAKLEFGEIPTGDSGVGVITLTNRGETDFTLLDCKTSCGCTTANCQKGRLLHPGETTEVEIKLDGGDRARKLNKTVTFLVDNGHPPIVCQVSGESIAYVTYEPERLDPEAHPDGKIVLRSIDGTPFAVRSMYPPVIDDLPQYKAVTHTLNLDWDRMREEGHRQRKILFRLDHPKCQKIQVALAPTAIEPIAAGPTGAAGPVPGAAPGQGTGRIGAVDRMLRDGQEDRVIEMVEQGTLDVTEVDSSAQTLLIKAARWGAVKAIAALVQGDSDIEAVDKMGRTPLMYACQSKNLEAVRTLLDAGADINRTDLIGNNALCWAAGFGTPEIVQELIDGGANIEIQGGMIGFTPLIWASGFGDSKSVEAIIAAGGNVEAADVLQGATCLMHAVRTGMVANARQLIDAGANLEARDNEGSTPLMIACRNAGADVETLMLLVDSGADLTVKDNAGKSLLDRAKARTDLRAADVLAELETVLEEHGLLDG